MIRFCGRCTEAPPNFEDAWKLNRGAIEVGSNFKVAPMLKVEGRPDVEGRPMLKVDVEGRPDVEARPEA